MDEINGGGKPRFDALDGVRAAAILAGVYYHAILFASMARGRMPIPGVPGGASQDFQEYLHSFRMPLFFLISGFFSRMMLGKYGTRGYLARRWSRIGPPLLVGLFAIVPIYQLTRSWPSGLDGPPPGMVGGPGGLGKMPHPSPLARSDADGDGVLGPEERTNARESFSRGGLGLNERIFGPAARLFKLEFLWFLWYLLIFTTIAPWLVRLPGRLFPGVLEEGDRAGRGGLWLGLVPLAPGLIGGLAQMITSNPIGWSLPLAGGIFRGVPDFAFHVEADMPFYLVYFLAGWWLHRGRDALPEIARAWMPYLLAGLAAHSASMALQSRYAGQGVGMIPLPIRLGGTLLYGIGSSGTAFGFLALFQRFLDRPTRVGRYLADTALWVYLIHILLLTPLLGAVTPMDLPWWLEGALVTLIDTAIALVLFEAVIRPTPLVRVFGSGAAMSKKSRPMAAAALEV